MGVYNPNSKYGITLGSDKQSAYLMLSEYLKGYKVTKTELLSIFTNESDRKTAEQLFNLWNSIKNDDGSEEYINGSELEGIGFQVLYYADNNEAEDDPRTNLSDIEVQQLYEKKGITGSSSVLFKMVRYMATKDIATTVESGAFNINGEKKDMHVIKMKGIDPDGKTYKLMTNSGYSARILGEKVGQDEEYIANFNGKNPELKTLTSRIYASFLDDELFELVTINAPNGVIGTAGKIIKNEYQFDNNKKLALDILFGNNAASDSVSFDNAFDTNKDGIKKAFTIIPEEIEDIIAENNYSRNDLIKALKIIAKITDEQIDEMLDTQEAKYEYKSILMKRRDFCKELLLSLKKEKKSQQLTNQIEEAKISALSNFIHKIIDIKDINAFEREIRKIADNNIKEELYGALMNKKAELTKMLLPSTVPQISIEDFNKKIKEFGFIVVGENDSDKDISLSDEYEAKYKDIASKLMLLDYNYLFKCVNLRAESGIDVLKDEETFVRFLQIEDNFNDCNGEPKKYDYNIYMTLLDVYNVPINTKNNYGITQYKDDNTYRYFHEMYKANNETGMQIIQEINEKYGLEGVSQFLNKASIPLDTTMFRGQELSMMDNIELSDGSILSKRMQSAINKLPDETEINNVIEEFNKLGDIILNEPKFISTSVNKDVAEEFARKKEGILMNITLPAGSKAACLDGLVSNRYEKCEEEILVQRGSDYIINGLSFDKEKKFWIVNCTIETK